MIIFQELFNTLNQHTDQIAAITGIIALFISISEIVYSHKANKKADQANKIAQEANEFAKKANEITEKEHMPFIKLNGNFIITQKKLQQLDEEITFDIDNVLDDIRYDGSMCDNPEEKEIPCVTIEVENSGKGVVTGIEINELFIKEGKTDICTDVSGAYKTLCDYNKLNCSQNFYLEPGDKKTINICLFYEIEDRFCIDSDEIELEYINECMQSFYEQCEYLFITMHLNIKSINKTCYKNIITGTYYNSCIKNYELVELCPV